MHEGGYGFGQKESDEHSALQSNDCRSPEVQIVHREIMEEMVGSPGAKV